MSRSSEYVKKVYDLVAGNDVYKNYFMNHSTKEICKYNGDDNYDIVPWLRKLQESYCKQCGETHFQFIVQCARNLFVGLDRIEHIDKLSNQSWEDYFECYRKADIRMLECTRDNFITFRTDFSFIADEDLANVCNVIYNHVRIFNMWDIINTGTIEQITHTIHEKMYNDFYDLEKISDDYVIKAIKIMKLVNTNEKLKQFIETTVNYYKEECK